MMPVILQLLRFGIVGVAAALLHYTIVVSLVTYFTLEPLSANIIGFLCGVQVSYWGHRLWTFRGTAVSHRVAAPRLLLLQTCNFIANESLFYALLSLGLIYNVALIITLAVLPLLTFTISKFWVFAGESQA